MELNEVIKNCNSLNDICKKLFNKTNYFAPNYLDHFCTNYLYVGGFSKTWKFIYNCTFNCFELFKFMTF